MIETMPPPTPQLTPIVMLLAMRWLSGISCWP
jgi:hypothetical protein